MITGIELGPSACVLVRTRRESSARGARPAIAAARRFDARDSGPLPAALARARREDGFSARARVVAWGGPGSQIALDRERPPDVSALVEAGFEIESIVSPPQALAMLVESLRVDTRRAVAAAALNRTGAALAIIHHGQVIAARTFEWPLGEPFRAARPELLERYLVISQLAPQLQHLIDLAAPVYDAPVSSVVLCGSLPDLRSLSMLLIEEMDVDVETLDSAESIASAVPLETESAAGLQLAAAVASSAERSSAAAAAVPKAIPVRRGGERRSVNASAIRSLIGAAAVVLCALWASLQVAGSAPAAPAFPPAPGAGTHAAARAPSAPQPEATIGRLDAEPVPSPPAAPPGPSLEPAAAEPLSPPHRPTPSRAEATGAVSRPRSIEPLIAADPLPRVDGIAIAGERKLAILDGAIVGIGDLVGRRTVTRIDTTGVVLRNPGGSEVFVAIRPRKPPSGGPLRP